MQENMKLYTPYKNGDCGKRKRVASPSGSAANNALCRNGLCVRCGLFVRCVRQVKKRGKNQSVLAKNVPRSASVPAGLPSRRERSERRQGKRADLYI